MTNTYHVGDATRISTTTVFTDIDDASFNPDVVTFRWRRPGQTAAEAESAEQVLTWPDDNEVTQEDVGDFYIDLELDEAGLWRYRVEGTSDDGDLLGADEGSLKVLPSKF